MFVPFLLGPWLFIQQHSICHGQTSQAFKTQASLELFYKQLVVFLGSFFFLFLDFEFPDKFS